MVASRVCNDWALLAKVRQWLEKDFHHPMTSDCAVHVFVEMVKNLFISLFAQRNDKSTSELQLP